ncbi:deoxyribonuclease IV [Mesoplasma chauliocola]|uniref:Probable endonuclease 4 n=1 Tax=Mesoplasma chauliocola TaxID=216427 RepID=A0A249SN72_9MOLU|nr:deoxyribonuclease IV [Mesoplasma chauliocola]ASZ09098.1 deoxyribonuclease IV [Mesoplasma chauliocola]
MEKPILGSHVGMSKANKHGEYLIGSVNEALSYGANTLMIYTGPPQNSKRTQTDKLHIEEFNKILAQNNIEKRNIIVHAPYIINISNPVNQTTWDFGVDFLKQEIQRCEDLGVNILVLHPGARLKGEYIDALNALIKGLNAVASVQKNVIIALETMSGKGTEVGLTLKDFKYVLDNVNEPSKVAVCLDTCHMHDAGYDFNDWNSIKKEIENTITKEKVVCFHLNDSKNPLLAHKDRHENIGYGFIGFDNLLSVLWDDDYIKVPKILETPYVEDKPPYKEEIDNLINKKFTKKVK